MRAIAPGLVRLVGLLEQRRWTLAELAAAYGCAPHTLSKYLSTLTASGAPLRRAVAPSLDPTGRAAGRPALLYWIDPVTFAEGSGQHAETAVERTT